MVKSVDARAEAPATTTAHLLDPSRSASPASNLSKLSNMSKNNSDIFLGSNESKDARDGDPNISRPIEVTASESTTTMNGHAAARVPTIDYSLLPGGSRSLCSIALHGFAIGTAFGLCIFGGVYFAYHGYRIWRLPQFIATLAVFHFLEFYTTSRWATVNAKVSSYLLFSNGRAYNIAHASAMLEIILSSLVFPDWQAKLSNPVTIAIGLVLVVVGQTVRSVAMAQAGKSFNHIPQRRKREDHVLVTSGIYGYIRHPSYFGYYWFAVGTQIAVGNKICALIYAVTLYFFFARRIPDEEKYLIEFFEDDYRKYKTETGTGLPFIR